MFKTNWWKYLCILLVLLNINIGLLMSVPFRPNLEQSIRNYFFHPPLWIAMMIHLTISLIYSIRYLNSNSLIDDGKASIYTGTGMGFGLLGITTGMFWARFTWGAYWTGDPKLTGTAIGLLIYAAYFVLRGSTSGCGREDVLDLLDHIRSRLDSYRTLVHFHQTKSIYPKRIYL